MQLWLAPWTLMLTSTLVLAVSAEATAQTAHRSVEVLGSGLSVRSAPFAAAPRRGVVRVGTFLPLQRQVTGPGCDGPWFEVGDDAFVCSTFVRPSANEPAGEAQPRIRPGDLLPRNFAFVRTDGAWTYSRPEDYFVDNYLDSLGQGFGIAITHRTQIDGVSFVRAHDRYWVLAADIAPARGSLFAGVVADSQQAAWTLRETPVFQVVDGQVTRSRLRRLGRRAAINILPTQPDERYVLTSEGAIARRDVVLPIDAPVPTDLAPLPNGQAERWIDIDLSTQTLTAYEGPNVVFRTLISAGRGSRTPTGQFRVWVKLPEDDMDNFDDPDATSTYSIEAVPWVQYFVEGIGLHAAFWHDRFGEPRSHGCINLSPRDARYLFEWTTPALPPGWDAIFPTAQWPGTRIRIRRS